VPADVGLNAVSTSALSSRRCDLRKPEVEDLSPNGKHVAFDRRGVGLARDIFLMDIEKGSTSLFASSGAADFAPVWSPDGRTIAFASSRAPATNIAPTMKK
jgi:Tol biopolymer transport system component